MPLSELAEYVSKACFGVHTRDLITMSYVLTMGFEAFSGVSNPQYNM